MFGAFGAGALGFGDVGEQGQAAGVATGASPAAPPIPGLAGAGYLTSATALQLERVPPRLVVLGASAVGLELGQFFLHAGAEVTFLDIADRIAPFEEPEVSQALAGVLTDQGAVMHAGARALEVRRDGGQVRVSARADGRELAITAEEILVATGRRPNTGGLGLDAAGVATGPRGEVTVDAELRTANPKVLAAGDVTGAPQFVYAAAYSGAPPPATRRSRHQRVDLTGLPRVIFTAPQVAAAGLTEAEARAAGHDVAVSVLGLDAVPRALVNQDTRSVIKLVAEAASGRLLGASVVADGAGDVIQSAVLAVRHGITVTELAATFHPYLTMAEGIKLAARRASAATSASCPAARHSRAALLTARAGRARPGASPSVRGRAIVSARPGRAAARRPAARPMKGSLPPPGAPRLTAVVLAWPGVTRSTAAVGGAPVRNASRPWPGSPSGTPPPGWAS